jgi:hypothetical protein
MVLTTKSDCGNCETSSGGTSADGDRVRRFGGFWERRAFVSNRRLEEIPPSDGIRCPISEAGVKDGRNWEKEVLTVRSAGFCTAGRLDFKTLTKKEFEMVTAPSPYAKGESLPYFWKHLDLDYEWDFVFAKHVISVAMLIVKRTGSENGFFDLRELGRWCQRMVNRVDINSSVMMEIDMERTPYEQMCERKESNTSWFPTKYHYYAVLCCWRSGMFAQLISLWSTFSCDADRCEESGRILVGDSQLLLYFREKSIAKRDGCGGVELTPFSQGHHGVVVCIDVDYGVLSAVQAKTHFQAQTLANNYFVGIHQHETEAAAAFGLTGYNEFPHAYYYPAMTVSVNHSRLRPQEAEMVKGMYNLCHHLSLKRQRRHQRVTSLSLLKVINHRYDVNKSHSWFVRSVDATRRMLRMFGIPKWFVDACGHAGLGTQSQVEGLARFEALCFMVATYSRQGNAMLSTADEVLPILPVGFKYKRIPTASNWTSHKTLFNPKRIGLSNGYGRVEVRGLLSELSGNDGLRIEETLNPVE